MAEESRWGTVFMGPTSDRESRLDKIANRDEQETWNRRTEAEYLRRVRDRAVEQLNVMLAEARQEAEGILDAARQEADTIRDKARQLHEEAANNRAEAEAELAEAERIRLAGHDEGYSHGVEQALLELEEQRGHIDATTLSVLKAMEDQCNHLFESWREELAALLRQSVDTASGWVLDENRTAILEKLLEKSLEQLEQHRRIVVRANPEDAPAVEEVIDAVRRRFNDLQSWDIQPDPTMDPGGLVVESVSGKVDNRAETRRDIVEQALRHLTLPRSEADDQAVDNVLRIAAEAGVPALEQSVNEAEQRAAALAEQALAAQELEAQRQAEELAEQELAEQELAAQEQADAPQGESPDILEGEETQDALSQDQGDQPDAPLPDENPSNNTMPDDLNAPLPPLFNALPAAPQDDFTAENAFPAENNFPAGDDIPAEPDLAQEPDMADLMNPSLPPELAELLAADADEDTDEFTDDDMNEDAENRTGENAAADPQAQPRPEVQ